MAVDQELLRRMKAVVQAYQAEKACEGQAKELFSELEDEACDLGDAVTRAVLEERLQMQAAAALSRDANHPPDLAPCCPRCRRPGQKRDDEPRAVQTRRGEVSWNEPQYYCRKCRQAFFPSVPRFGNRSDGHA